MKNTDDWPLEQGLSQIVIPMPDLAIQPGQAVEVRVADGSWVGDLRAASKILLGEQGPEVWICREDEWQAAQREQRKPNGARWPSDQIRPVGV